MGRAPGSESHTCGPPLSCHCAAASGRSPIRWCVPHALARGTASDGSRTGAQCADQDPPCPLFSGCVIHSGHGVFQWVPCVSGPRDPGGD